MFDKPLYTTGITLKYGYAGNNQHGWSASFYAEDMGFCDKDSVCGTFGTKYFNPSLDETIQNVISIIKKMNIKFTDELAPDSLLKRCFYYLDDGESKEFPPPANWRETIRQISDKYDFACIYQAEDVE